MELVKQHYGIEELGMLVREISTSHAKKGCLKFCAHWVLRIDDFSWKLWVYILKEQE